MCALNPSITDPTMMKRTSLALTIFFLTALSANAQVQAEPKAPSPWTGNGQLSLSQHSGSLSTLYITLGHALSFRKGPSSWDFLTTYMQSAMRTERSLASGGTAERTLTIRSADVQSHYRRTFDGRNYVAFLTQWYRDPSQGISGRLDEAAGLGRNLILTQRGTSLQVEAIGGYLSEWHTNKERIHYPAFGGGINLSIPIGTGGSFSSSNRGFGNTGGRDDWLFTSRNSLNAQLNKVFGIAVNFTAMHDTKPSLAFFDPTGEGEINVSPVKRVTDLSASLTIRW